MSFQDSAVIFFLALLLFGPKKLPELARQLGKLMGEFRRASNEFRMQMEDELRVSEQAERQKQIAAIEAAAPPQAAAQLQPPAGLEPATEPAPAGGTIVETHASSAVTVPEPALFATPGNAAANGAAIPEHAIPEHSIAAEPPPAPDRYRHDDAPAAKPAPIATSGSLHMMPPATGLPVGRNGAAGVAQAFDAVPLAPEPVRQPVPAAEPSPETATHG